jgi:hypothetical protein
MGLENTRSSGQSFQDKETEENFLETELWRAAESANHHIQETQSCTRKKKSKKSKIHTIKCQIKNVKHVNK